MFVLMNSQLAQVALAILSFTAALVGLALGTLIPRPLAGAVLGASLALAVLVPMVPFVKMENVFGLNVSLVFPAIGGGLALVGGVISAR